MLMSTVPITAAVCTNVVAGGLEGSVKPGGVSYWGQATGNTLVARFFLDTGNTLIAHFT